MFKAKSGFPFSRPKPLSSFTFSKSRAVMFQHLLSGGVGGGGGLPKLHNDDFNDNVRDATFWNTYIAGTGNPIEQNQRLECFVSAINDIAGYVTIIPYDLTTCDISVRADISQANPTDELFIWLYIDATHYYFFLKNRPPWSVWQVHRNIGAGDVNVTNGVWGAANSIIRITIGAGTISFYENGVFCYSEAYALASYNCYVAILGNEWVAVAARMSWFDDFLGSN